MSFFIILSGCRQNIGSLSIISTRPIEIEERYESKGLIEGKSELVTSSSNKIVNLYKAIYNALTLFEAGLIKDVTLKLTTSTIFMTRRKLTMT